MKEHPPSELSKASASWIGAWVWFSLFQLIVCLFVFREALWGKSLLAPLDVLPACFDHYHFMDPTSNGIPSASLQFDQVVYDLPLQYGIYQAYRRGEIPWWDPYGYTGRPFLADAHINGTDPVRLAAYSVLPFELAYNWTRIGHFILSGVSMFLLLRYWSFPNWLCGLGALTFEFAGCQAFFFGFPWIQGSLLYYPFLWLAWDAAFKTGKWVFVGLGSMAVAGVFYAGNLQSHSYILLFTVAFGLGYGGLTLAAWRRVTFIVVISGLFGACLAAPVLLNQLEFFLQGVRGLKSAVGVRTYFLGFACLTSIYPWILGDFRTLDIRSAFFQPVGLGQNYGLGFHTFIGSAGLVLAAFGAFIPLSDLRFQRIRRTAVSLVLIFLLMVSSPFVTVFYTRAAGLFVLGAIVLASLSLQHLRKMETKFVRLGWAVAAVAIFIAFSTNVATLIVYPKFLPKVRRALREHEAAAAPGMIFKMPAAYRAFQIENLPNEISFKNPETVLAFLSLLSLAAVFLWPDLRQQTLVLPVLAMLNLAPALLFCHRLIPRQSLQMWERLLAGGPEQQKVIEILRIKELRLFETAPIRNQALFPDELEHLYQVHTVHGYSALVPRNIASLGLMTSSNQIPLADFVFQNDQLQPLTEATGKARFQWLNGVQRAVQVESESLNRIRLRLGPGTSASLLWTDTSYPGWIGTLDGRQVRLEHESPCFTRIQIPAEATSLTLTYRPRLLGVGIFLAGVGILCVLLSFVLPSAPARQQGSHVFS